MDDDSVVMRFKIEGKVDEKQIKQEMDSAQKIADSSKVTIPTKTEEVKTKDIKQEVKAVQKKVNKEAVELPVELPDDFKKLMKQYKAEIKSLSQLKNDPSEKKTQKLLNYDKQYAKVRKKYKDHDDVKKFDAFLDSSEMPKIRIQAKKTAEAQERALREQEKIANEQIKDAKQQKSKATKTDARTKLKEEKQKIIETVNEASVKREKARQNVQDAHFKEKKATEFVEGRNEDGIQKPGIINSFKDSKSSLEQMKQNVINATNNGKNKKAVDFWGKPNQYDKLIKSFQGFIDKGMDNYLNKETFVPMAQKEYETATKELAKIESEAAERLEEINKQLGPIEKLLVDTSNLTPKHYSDIFKESLPQQKFQLKIRKRTLTDDVADEIINRNYLEKLRKGASRNEAATVGSDTKLDLRQPSMSGPYVDTKRIIRTAIGGPYADTNSYVRAAMETQKASYKLAKETLEKFIVELDKLQEFIDKRNAEANAKAEAEGRMGIAGKGRNKNKFTEQEKNTHLSQITTELAGKEAKKISKGDPKADIESFEESLKASFGFLTKSLGPSIWKPLEQNINRIMANFDGGIFKITDDPIKGEGKNYAALAELLSKYFKDINEFFEQNEEMAMLAKVSMSLKNAARISEDSATQVLKDFGDFLRKFGYNPGRTPNSVRGTTTKKRNESPVKGNTLLARQAKETNKQLEKSNAFIKIGNVAQEENAETNRINANTGTDSEAGKNELVEATEKVGTTIEKTFDSGNGGNGGNNVGGGDLGDTGPSILEQIRDLLISINSYTTAIFDLLPKLKLTIKREKRSKKKDEISGDPSLYPVVAGEAKDLTPKRKIRGIVDVTDHNKLAEAFKERAALDDVRKRVFAKPYNTKESVKQIEDLLTPSTGESRVEISQDVSEVGKSLGDMIKKAFGAATATTEVDRIKNLNQAQREKELAELTKTYGIADRDRNVTSTGDKGRAFRMKSVYGYNQKNVNPFKDLKLTPGLEIDVKGITDSLQTMIEKNMFSAQTGVSGLGDVIKLSLGGIGMPSLEKSRAQADAANEILGIIRQAVLELLQAIQANETTLRGFEASGDAKFDDNGKMISGSNAAWTTFGQLEEQKSVLNGLIAELTKMDQLSAKTGGNMTKFFKVLGFVSPELRKCNTIISNINSGLDKNGKVLKFQSRFQETLNYSFQLLTRYIGQMIKGWMLMLNPINLIKKAFSDFMSYDTKWQRTMNVIKYNLRRIVKPMMEWIAQQLVNIIGLGNALVKGLGKAFGQNWDLFDKGAAQAEKDLEDLEAQASNVTLGFDELHDVGSDNSGANDLSEDIYTPQWTSLYEIIENFGKKIGDVLSGIKKLTEGWNFWTWLAVIGGALIGLKVLKWLIGLFGKGKNPLQSVADGLSFLEKAVGWAVLIWAFTEFTKALTKFIEVVKNMSPGEIAKALITLGVAFGILAVSCKKLMKWTQDFGTTTGQLFGLAALVGVFDLFIKAIIPFIECIKDLVKEFGLGSIGVIAEALVTLALAFVTLIGGVFGVEKVTSGIDLMGDKLFGLAAVVGALDLFVAAITPFLKTIGELGDEKWSAIGGMITGLVGAFISLAVGVALVSKFFTAMDWKAIGQLYVVAGAFEVFMFTLIPFVNAIKDVPFETLAGGTILIAGAFIALGVAIKLMAPALTMLNWSSLAMGIVLMTAMAGIIWVLSEFTKSLQDLTGGQILSGLALLAVGLLAITAAITVLAVVFTAVATTGIGLAALALLAVVLAAVMGIIYAFAELVRALGESGEGIKLILEGVAQVIETIANGIATVLGTIGGIIIGIVEAVANGIKTVLEPILTFIDNVIGKVLDLAGTIAHEIGETIRTVIETVGNIILGIVDKIVNAIPNLLNSIVNFCHNIGPAIENTVDAICRTITKLVNFVVSAVEYIANLVIGAINKFSVQVPDWVPGIGGSTFGFNLQKIEIPRFVPKYEKGTNYVPNDGLAYLHQGEAVIPKKYNQPYSPGLSVEERAYMDKMIATMNRLDGTIAQGINVKGEFRQRGNDLVATVEKNKSRQSNTVLNNKVYAR